MKALLNSIRFDYLQRTRNYNFLITLCATLAIAYTFVPEPNANYSTIRINGYVGYYNAAWFGYVTAIMTSIFLSLIGFYLVNSSIKNDADSKVGQIIAASKMSNFSYLFSKVIGNFLVLSTIVFCVFLMSIILFFLYNDGYSFHLLQFIKPYLIITIPAIFITANVAVIFEVLLRKSSTIQNVSFFLLFSMLMVFNPKNETQFSFDAFGSKIVTHQLEESVRKITNTDKKTSMSIGYILGNVTKAKKFDFNGVDFPVLFILSRFLWMFLAVGLIALISPLFYRFNVSKKIRSKKNIVKFIEKKSNKEIAIKDLPKASVNFGIFPIIKTELLLLFRKGKKWLWFINITGMGLLVILPLETAHKMVLPILWFLQVHRISNITSKEITNNTYLLSFSSYKPIGRILVSKVLGSIILILIISLPLLIKLCFDVLYSKAIGVLLGAIFLVLISATLGLLSKGKKLFEVLFFLTTYCNINGIPFLDYFAGFKDNLFFLVTLLFINLILMSVVFNYRKIQLKYL